MSQHKTRSGYRSLFWPIMLISLGLILLLSNAGMITIKNVIALLRMWPLLLIIIGLDLLFGRRSPILGALIGLGAVALAVVIMLVGPSMGLAGEWEIKTFQESVPIGGAESAEVALNLSVGETRIAALRDSPDLLDANLRYIGGDVRLSAAGAARRTVELTQDKVDLSLNGPFDFLSWLFEKNEGEDLRWDVRLSDRVPLELTINGGLGTISLDLSDLNLTGLNLSTGAGAVTLTLPEAARAYLVHIDGGIGPVEITVPDAAALDMQINGGVGSFTIDIPRDAAVRIDVSGGLKTVDIPAYFDQVREGEGQNGTWETPGFGSAERRITIEYEGGLGALTVK
ncbi:MAG: hypothetical protein JXB47_13825 [Anaerolineae bacterium]|nr:hypothetical protein [Anaerolineae bacterium]